MNKEKKNNEDIVCYAVIDGINIFCRDILIQKGYLSKKDWEDETLLDEKYRIAEKVSKIWKND